MKGQRKIDRREFLKKAALAGTTLIGLEMLGCAPPAAPPVAPTSPAAAPTLSKPAATPTPSEADRVAQLIEGAKKEGKLMYYGVGPDPQVAEELDIFMKKYPFIKFESFVAPDEPAVEKITTEARAGKTVADVVRVSATGLYALLKEDLLVPYDSPERQYFLPIAKDPQARWTARHWAIHVMVYNTKAVSKAEAPKTYEDLLDPKWKGQLGIENECLEWFTYQLKIRGKEKGTDFMKKLAAQNPKLVKGHSALMKLNSAGEIPIQIMSYQYMIQAEMEKGAPLQWVAVNPVSASITVHGIVKNAPHPNAAKLYIDWSLSEEGQKLVIANRAVPPRTGMKPEPAMLTQGVELFPFDPNIPEESRGNAKLFREIFGTM
ncbi:MAG: extracellular solute-binding protein [Chloroflexi bacterium]|nr:extracellular solute-binding protein [Chloroflexota bacterium]